MSENLPDPAEQNVERLLSEAYQPEDISSDFAERTLARLERIAAGRRRRPQPPEPTPWKRVAWLYFANAVAILLLIILPSLFWHYFIEPTQEDRKEDLKKKTPLPSDRLAPRQKTTTPPLRTLAPGQVWLTANDLLP